MAGALSEARLRTWMEDLGPRLIVLSTGICRDRHQAEEIVQEAFVKLWKAPPDAGEVAYSSWMRKVVTNLSINALRRTKRPGALPEDGLEESRPGRPTTQETADAAEELELVREAMDDLDEDKRAILMLRAQEQLSYEAIATHLGVPVGTVMSRLNRARAALTERMAAGRKRKTEEPEAYSFQKYKRA